jgi:Bardet-Biedl syndrome 5 protein
MPEEIVELDESLNDLSNALVTYSLDQREEAAGKPVYCPELGLAVEKLSDGYTMQSLWEVLPPQTGTAE